MLKYLLAHHDLCGVRLRGASAGALIAALAACEVDLDAAVVRAHELAQEHGVYDRYAAAQPGMGMRQSTATGACS